MLRPASLTVAAIDAAIKADQGNAFRGWLQKVLPHVGDAYGQNDSPFRSHMGASGIGKECPRAVWYSFRWATKPNFEGRMLRLFNRGHIEEARFIAMLLMIGCQVFQQDANGKQFRISDAGGHFGGSGDGVVVGLPDLPPGMPALAEFKTHNAKSFAKLAEQGVRISKPEHYVQMNVYMRKMGLNVGLYLAVNKDDDTLHGEIVHLDPELADRYIDRGVQLVFMPTAPKRVNDSPSWFACKFCDHRAVCHMGATPEKNCRTCEHSVPREDGTWWCESEDRRMTMLFGPKPDVSDAGETYELSKARQLRGCSYWRKHPTAFR